MTTTDQCRWTFDTGTRSGILRCELPAGHLGPWHRHGDGHWPMGDSHAAKLPEPLPDLEPMAATITALRDHKPGEPLTVAGAIALLLDMIIADPSIAGQVLNADSGRIAWGEVTGFSVDSGRVWVDVKPH